jgi:hypothetical protein
MIANQTLTPAEIETIFRELVNQWQEQTRGISTN